MLLADFDHIGLIRNTFSFIKENVNNLILSLSLLTSSFFILIYSSFSHFPEQYTIVGFLIVTFALHNNYFKKFLKLSLFTKFGDISFIAYLVHIPIIFSIYPLLISLIIDNSINLSYLNVSLILLLPCVLIILFIANLLTKYIDKPSIIFSKYFSKIVNYTFN